MFTFENSISIFREIEKVSNEFLKKELIEKAYEYARIRAGLQESCRQERVG